MNDETTTADIRQFLTESSILLVVPPIASIEVPSLAAHLLQAECEKIGIKTDVWYANISLAKTIGFSLYRTIGNLNLINFIGERLFASSAFNLPTLGKNVHRLIDTDFIPDHFWQNRNETATKRMTAHFAPLRDWILSIDWDRIEKTISQWQKNTARIIGEMNYPIVGCTNTLGGLVPPVSLLHHIKQANPSIITVIGGANCEGEMAEGILSLKSSIDYIFSGCSDHTFPTFAHNFIHNTSRPTEKIIRSQEFTETDELPLPNYNDYFKQMSKSGLKPPPEHDFPILYETSRGCKWKQCVFCGLTGKRKHYTYKTPGKVFQDIRHLTQIYPQSPIYMSDNLMPHPYIKNLLPQIADELPFIRMRYEVQSGLTLEEMEVLKKAGITRIQPGIESLSPSLLKRMRKNVSLKANIATLRYGRALNMDIAWNILVGFPGDRCYEYQETIEIIPLIRHLQPPETVPPVKICRFSRYHTEPQAFGISNLRPASLYGDVLPPHTDLEKIAFFFAADYSSAAYEDPHLLSELRKEYEVWLDAWNPPGHIEGDCRLPRLHIEPNPASTGLTDEFILHDTRKLPQCPEQLYLSKEKAVMLTVPRPWNTSIEIQWAIDSRLGIIKDNQFIPLATADPELLRRFEKIAAQKENKPRCFS